MSSALPVSNAESHVGRHGNSCTKSSEYLSIDKLFPRLIVLCSNPSEAHTHLVFVTGRLRPPHSCSAGSNPRALTVWPHYIVQIFYDILVLLLSSYYLVTLGPKSGK